MMKTIHNSEANQRSTKQADVSPRHEAKSSKPAAITSVMPKEIDREGKGTDQKTREKINELLESLVALTHTLKGA
jgi:hypothetical protein